MPNKNTLTTISCGKIQTQTTRYIHPPPPRRTGPPTTTHITPVTAEMLPTPATAGILPTTERSTNLHSFVSQLLYSCVPDYIIRHQILQYCGSSDKRSTEKTKHPKQNTTKRNKNKRRLKVYTSEEGKLSSRPPCKTRPVAWSPAAHPHT